MNNEALQNLIDAFQNQAIFNDYQAKDYSLMDDLQEDIQFAWDDWSDDVTREHWESSEKPEDFTASFAEEYLENEDFEAAGYSLARLNSLFA